MKTIQIIGGIPAEMISRDALRIDRDGDVLTVWEKGDAVPPLVTLAQIAAAEAAADAEATQERTEADQLRAVLAALKAGTGTAAERLTRIEKVLHFMAVRVLRSI